MSESDGNPPPDSQDPRHAVPPSPAPLAPAPRVNPPNITSRQRDTPPVPGGPTNFNDFMQWARAFGGGEPPPDDGGAAQRALIPKEKKKFQRQDTETRVERSETARAPESPAQPAQGMDGSDTEDAPPRPVSPPSTVAPPVSVSPAPDRTDAVADPRGGFSAGVPLTSRGRRVKDAKRGRSTGFWIAVQAGALLLLAGVFYLGRISAPEAAPPPPAAPAAPTITSEDGKTTLTLLSPQNSDRIDQAMAALQNSDFRKAADLLEQVKSSGEHVKGIDVQLAYVAVFAEEPSRAIPLLNQAIAANDETAECYNLRGTINSRRAGPQGGLNDFEIATKLDPFNARYFFFLGEALRRAGKPQAAMLRLKQAADRAREPAQIPIYQLKIRLAQIEAGQEKEFAEEMKKQLAQTPTPLDWLITAAAVEMHNGRFTAAAGYLDKAAATSDPAAFYARLHDYYLFGFKYEKELVRFYKEPPAETAVSGNTPPAAASSPAGSPGAANLAPTGTGLELAVPPPASPGLAPTAAPTLPPPVSPPPGTSR